MYCYRRSNTAEEHADQLPGSSPIGVRLVDRHIDAGNKQRNFSAEKLTHASMYVSRKSRNTPRTELRTAERPNIYDTAIEHEMTIAPSSWDNPEPALWPLLDSLPTVHLSRGRAPLPRDRGTFYRGPTSPSERLGAISDARSLPWCKGRDYESSGTAGSLNP